MKPTQANIDARDGVQLQQEDQEANLADVTEYDGHNSCTCMVDVVQPGAWNRPRALRLCMRDMASGWINDVPA